MASLATTTAANNICNQAPYSAILPLSTFAPAEAYCSLFYPLPVATVTSTTTPLTTTTLTLQIEVYNTQTSGLSTVYVSTETDLATVTATPVEKRAAAPTASQASLWAKFTGARGANAIKTACSCIETAKTVTKTVTAKTSTLTATAYSYTTSTAVVPSTTAETTTTTTTTTTTAAAAAACTTINTGTFVVEADTGLAYSGCADVEISGDLDDYSDCTLACGEFDGFEWRDDVCTCVTACSAGPAYETCGGSPGVYAGLLAA